MKTAAKKAAGGALRLRRVPRLAAMATAVEYLMFSLPG
jgi:hypothetical protein